MINQITLNNFKCFQHAELELKRLTILTGANASGKSSIIQSLIMAERTGQLGEKQGIDVNQLFGFQIGAPSALICQNPIEGEKCDFSIEVTAEEQNAKYCYYVNPEAPLELQVNRTGTCGKWNLQYLNAERVGPRMVNQAGRGDGILCDGDNAAYLIDVANRTERPVGELMKVEQASNKFSHFVEAWMSVILGDLQLYVHTDYTKAVTELKIRNSLVEKEIVPTLTGFGISYVLPLVVAGLWATAEKNSILILENPEAHLHPYAQSNVGKFIALLAASGVQVIVETHSEHIIDGARWQSANLELADQVLVHFMENTGTKVRINSITVNDKGELSAWPVGFFDQKQNDLRDILKLRMKANGSK